MSWLVQRRSLATCQEKWGTNRAPEKLRETDASIVDFVPQLVMKLAYVAQDRFDVSEAVKCLSRDT